MSNFFVEQVESLYFFKSDTKSRLFLTGAAQGFAVPAQRDRKAYVCTAQPESRGERRSAEKLPFMDGN
jgi:hypothetical protein